MCTSRSLNRIENHFFVICRNGDLDQTGIVVENIEQFEANLNERFGFCYIKKWINFSLFVMAGKFKN